MVSRSFRLRNVPPVNNDSDDNSDMEYSHRNFFTKEAIVINEAPDKSLVMSNTLHVLER